MSHVCHHALCTGFVKYFNSNTHIIILCFANSLTTL
nr:MAG TPA: ATP synthase F1 subunit alpha protein [Caudoviricetes sp.]